MSTEAANIFWNLRIAIALSGFRFQTALWYIGLASFRAIFIRRGGISS